MGHEARHHIDPSAAQRERAVLVALGGRDDRTLRSLEELALLVHTAGARPVAELRQDRKRPHMATYVGKGKLEELKALIAAEDADFVVVNDELNTSQVRNLETALDCKVLDRTELILDIFAQRARSLEGKIQVELAQINYLLPRLTGRGKLLSRIGGTGRSGGRGPIGTRGPGETKLEVDRRRLGHRATVLRRRLENVQQRRAKERAGREGTEIPTIALVGYTNAGKSSLLNALAGCEIEAEDRLFQTLDPTIRRVRLAGPAEAGPGREALFTDTVGFIERLPHHLVAAFRATLQEVEEADLLVHVVDISTPDFPRQAAAVDEVLTSLHLQTRPQVLALNKVDLLPNAPPVGPAQPDDTIHGVRLASVERFGGRLRPAVYTSATQALGLSDLLRAVAGNLEEELVCVTLRIPYDRMDLLQLSYELGRVVSREYGPEAIVAEAEVTPALLGRLRAYVVTEE